MWERMGMGRLGVALLVLVVCAGVAVPVAGSKPKPLPLRARVIERGEFPGFGPFEPHPQTTTITSARRWISGDTSYTHAEAAAAVAALEREGFKEVLVEQLGPLTKNWAGVSWVAQLDTAASARAALAADVRHWASTNKPPKATYTAFAVASIPGAHGYNLGGTGGSFVGDNIEFADGPFLYSVMAGTEA